jgi:PTH1 family peptidyl-tRNA hydrolase
MCGLGRAFDVLPLALSGKFEEAMKRLHTAA